MKILLIGKCINLLIISLICLTYLQSCKKENAAPAAANSLNKVSNQKLISQRTNTKSAITIEKILDWLNAQKGPEDSAANRNKFIQTIALNLVGDSLVAQEWGKDEFFISIPVKAHNSLHDDGKNSSPYLVVFEDDKGQIRDGELSIISRDSSEVQVSQDKLKDLYLNNDIGFKGVLKLITFQDFEFAEKIFNGNLKSYVGTYGERTSLGECIHWYHLHVDYNMETGEIIDWFVEDLGCLSCAPNSLCDHLDPIGGGLIQNPTTTQLTVDMFGEHDPVNYNDYDFSVDYTVTGIRRTPRSQSTFSGNNALVYVAGSETVNWNTGSILITPDSYYYFTFNVFSHTENNTATTATGVANFLLTYPHQFTLSGQPRQAVKYGYHQFLPTDI